MANKEPKVEDQENNRNPDGTFKEGSSGNPAGRPPGSYSIMTIIKKRMEEAPPGQIRPYKELLADVILEEAFVKHDNKMIEMVVEYMDGKPKQTVDLDVNKEGVESLTDLLRQMSQYGPNTTNRDPGGSGTGGSATETGGSES